MAFKHCNSAPIFQRLVNNILTDQYGLTVAVFIDYVIVYASSLEENFERMTNLIQRSKDANLTLSSEKYELFKKKLIYLGRLMASLHALLN